MGQEKSRQRSKWISRTYPPHIRPLTLQFLQNPCGRFDSSHRIFIRSLQRAHRGKSEIPLSTCVRNETAWISTAHLLQVTQPLRERVCLIRCVTPMVPSRAHTCSLSAPSNIYLDFDADVHQRGYSQAYQGSERAGSAVPVRPASRRMISVFSARSAGLL